MKIVERKNTDGLIMHKIPLIIIAVLNGEKPLCTLGSDGND